MSNDNAPYPACSPDRAVLGENSSALMGLMNSMAPAKFCILMYLHWHTYGQGKPADALTRDDFENGKCYRGERQDHGCGLYAEVVDRALTLLVEDGYVRLNRHPIWCEDLYTLHWENITR